MYTRNLSVNLFSIQFKGKPMAILIHNYIYDHRCVEPVRNSINLPAEFLLLKEHLYFYDLRRKLHHATVSIFRTIYLFSLVFLLHGNLFSLDALDCHIIMVFVTDAKLFYFRKKKSNV